MPTKKLSAFIKHGNWSVHVVVVRETDTKKYQYTFMHRSIDHRLVLLSFKFFKLKEGKYVLKHRWSRASMPDYPNSLNMADIPTSKRIKALALEKFVETVRIKNFADAKDGPLTDKLKVPRERKDGQRNYPGKRKSYSKKKYRKKYRRKNS